MIKNKKVTAVCMIMAMLLLGGCSTKQEEEIMLPKIENYSKNIFETCEVVRGDIVPVLEMNLIGEEYGTKSYFPKFDGMTITAVNVSVGDKVKKGDVLIEFDAGDMEEQLNQYNLQLEQDNILLEHYENLAKIDSANDYSDNIAALKEDIRICNLYIAELNEKLSYFVIKAEGEGTINYMYDMLTSEHDNMIMYSDSGAFAVDTSSLTVDSLLDLISVSYGTGIYTSEVFDDYNFNVGDKFTATYGVGEYPLEVIDVEKSGNKQIIKFKGCDENVNYSNRDKLNINIEKPALKNVVYIAEDYIFNVDDKDYVYVVGEDGYRELREIKIGITADGYVIIESGLEPGEKVTLK